MLPINNNGEDKPMNYLNKEGVNQKGMHVVFCIVLLMQSTLSLGQSDPVTQADQQHSCADTKGMQCSVLSDFSKEYGERLARVSPALTSVIGIPNPSTEDVMAAGQLGGLLHPNRAPSDLDDGLISSTLDAENADFAHAMDEWNQHNYTLASSLMEQYVTRYPQGIWVGEAELHQGCDARFNGRYRDANERFTRIVSNYEQSDFEGAQLVAEKAKSRLAVLRVMENNLDEAQSLFSELKSQGSDWRQRTYAISWIQRIAKLKAGANALANCGSRALGEVLERDGKLAAAQAVRTMTPTKKQGFSIRDLQLIATKHHYQINAIKMDIQDLPQVPLPAIAHIDRSATGGLGHYWIVEEVKESRVTLFDEQKHRRFVQSFDEFAQEWDGTLLVITEQERTAALPGTPLSAVDASITYGGCCGIQRPENDLGNPKNPEQPEEPEGCDDGRGCPVWSINKVNLNHYVTDTPLWYDAVYGPDVNLKLSYNSQSALAQYEPFGNKWSFRYGSYIVEDPGQTATVFMADGKRAVYISAGGGGFERAYGEQAILSKISADHYSHSFPNGDVNTYSIPEGTASQQVMLTKITDIHGDALLLHYDASVKLISIEDAQGLMTWIRYAPGSARINEVEDPFGRIAYFNYDAQGNLVTITDMGGYASQIRYDENAFIVAINKPEEGVNEPEYGFDNSDTQLIAGDTLYQVWVPVTDIQWGVLSVALDSLPESNQSLLVQGSTDIGSFANIADSTGRVVPVSQLATQTGTSGFLLLRRYQGVSIGNLDALQLANTSQVIATATGDASIATMDVLAVNSMSGSAATQDLAGNLDIANLSGRWFHEGRFVINAANADNSGTNGLGHRFILSGYQDSWRFYTEPADGINNSADGYPAPGEAMWENYRITITDPNNAKSEYYYNGLSPQGFYVSATNYIEYQDGTINNSTSSSITDYDFNAQFPNRGEISKIKVIEKGTGKWLADKKFTYNDQGQVTLITRWNIPTEYVYNAAGQLSDITEALGRPDERTTYTDYFVNYLNLPSLIIYPTVSDGSHLERIFAYDNRLNLETITDRKIDSLGVETDRVTTISYNSFQQITQIDGPRTDVNDVTHFVYYSDCSQISLSTCGRLETMTDAFGNVTRILEYQLDGKVSIIEDPNGLKTGFEYDNLGRLTQTSVPYQSLSGLTTNYTYQGPKRLKSVIRSGGQSIEYLYSRANKLEGAIDQQGNHLKLGIDAEGNPETIEIRTVNGLVVRQQSREFNPLGQVTSIDSLGRVQDIDYFEGKLFTVTLADGSATRNTYDDLNRVEEVKTTPVVFPLDQDEINYINLNYESSDQIQQVSQFATNTDADYQSDAYAEINQRISDDTGTTLYDYDNAGNRVYSQDARLVETDYQYDAQNRLIKTDYANNSEDIVYSYDSIVKGNKGVGQLTGIADESGSQSFFYDSLGRLIRLDQTIESRSYTTSYGYNIAGELITVSLPSSTNIQINYQQTQGEVTRVGVSIGRAPEIAVADQITYLPFGPIESINYGNGLTHIRKYNLDYQITNTTTVGIVNKSYTYSDSGHIDAITDSIDSGQTLRVHSTGFGRIDAIDQFDAIQVIRYHRSGNRDRVLTCPKGQFGVDTIQDCVDLFAATESSCGSSCDINFCDYASDPSCPAGSANAPSYSLYNYDNSRENHLTDIDGKMRTYNAMGATTSKDGWTLDYNEQGRLSSAISVNDTLSYVYNGFGQRTIKTLNGLKTYYLYDYQGQLIAETDTNGNINKQYIYLNGEPLAQVSNGNLYYYHNSHLGTPEVLTDSSATVVWQADYAVFGDARIRTETIENNLRFPGQYFDQETGLHYNGFRYYDSETGRYISSDPIGYGGGWNTYVYVGGNPLFYIDPSGLTACYVSFPDYPITYSPGRTSTWLGGHAGILGFDENGSTRYYEFGRYSPNRNGVFGEKLPSDQGNVRRVRIPDLEIDADGSPTPESMQRLRDALSRKAGRGTETELTCDADADENDVYDYADGVANDANRLPYNWKPWSANHCRTFAGDAFGAGQ